MRPLFVTNLPPNHSKRHTIPKTSKLCYWLVIFWFCSPTLVDTLCTICVKSSLTLLLGIPIASTYECLILPLQVPIRNSSFVTYFTGTLKIKWMEMEAGSMIPFEEFQMLLNDKVDIFRVNRKKPQEAWIFPGKHVYEWVWKNCLKVKRLPQLFGNFNIRNFNTILQIMLRTSISLSIFIPQCQLTNWVNKALNVKLSM